MGRRLNDARKEAERRGVGSYERHILLCIGPDCCSERAGEAAWQQLKKRVAAVRARPAQARSGGAPSGLARLPRRLMRAARHARYHVAVWIRGEAQQR